jgi:hypothetical protein
MTDGVRARLDEESTMYEPWLCSGGKHLPPATGGSCACGMVTRIPAPKRPSAAPPSEVLALLAQCLDDGVGGLDAAAAGLLRARADRLMSALSTHGLVLSAGTEDLMAA